MLWLAYRYTLIDVFLTIFFNLTFYIIVLQPEFLKRRSTRKGKFGFKYSSPLPCHIWHVIFFFFLGGEWVPSFDRYMFPLGNLSGSSPLSLQFSGTCHKFQKGGGPFSGCSTTRACTVKLQSVTARWSQLKCRCRGEKREKSDGLGDLEQVSVCLLKVNCDTICRC